MPDFALQYLAIREKEGRTYDDATLLALPEIQFGHQHYGEWQIRKQSAVRIWDDFHAKNKPLRILDLGCGNGWFAHGLSRIPSTEVIGLDVEGPEIQQAKKVFQMLQPQLSFISTDIFDTALDHERFDRITLGASIQYFADLPALIRRLRSLLSPNGEIHVFDSPFYPESELGRAKKRSVDYYEGMGFPELAQFYHHHSMKAAKGLGAIMKADPNSIKARFARKVLGKASTPFPWLIFK